MSRHEGVSCDSCLKGNFSGKRYKCLICYDYDLCAACYDAGVTSTRHSVNHPMQCILTRADFDLFYGGEVVSSEQHQSYTCPHCGQMGFTDTLLLEHVSTEHADVSSEVVCPVCAAYPGGEPNHVVDDLTAHLMLEHRNSNSDLDSQLSGMRAVRRIPHHGRPTSNPRTRRAANLQYQPTGSTLMVLSPGDRDREAIDPIAELLSQLSSVRNRSAAAQSISSQLQQLEMQLHTTRYGSSRLQAGDRLSASLPGDATAASRYPTMIAFPPTAEHPAAAAAAAVSGKAVVPGNTSAAAEGSPSLLARLDDSSKSELDLEAEESGKVDKSLFVQEMLLAVLTTDDVATGVAASSGDGAGAAAQTAAESQHSIVSNASTDASTVVPTAAVASVGPQQRSGDCSGPEIPPRNSSGVAAPKSGGRVALTTAASCVPPADSRILASTASRNVAKRKPVSTATAGKPVKDASGNTAKRH